VKDPAKPGPPPGGGTKIFMGVLLALGGLAIGIYAFASRGDAVDDNARTAVTIAGIVLPLLFFLGAYALIRVVFPPPVRGVSLNVPVTDVRRGDDVDAAVELSTDKPGLEVGLVCMEYYDVETTDGRGNRSRSTSQAVAYEDWRPHPGGTTQSVRFSVPVNAPYSYRGDCISYVWRVSARAPKRMRFDRSEHVPILVRP
jgi:hypothetical protein